MYVWSESSSALARFVSSLNVHLPEFRFIIPFCEVSHGFITGRHILSVTFQKKLIKSETLLLLIV